MNSLRHLLYFSLASIFACMILQDKSHGILRSRGYNLHCLKNRISIFGRNEKVKSSGSYFTENTYWRNHEYAKLCVHATELLQYANFGNALGYAGFWRHDAQGYKGPNSGWSIIYSLRLPLCNVQSIRFLCYHITYFSVMLIVARITCCSCAELWKFIKKLEPGLWTSAASIWKSAALLLWRKGDCWTWWCHGKEQKPFLLRQYTHITSQCVLNVSAVLLCYI
jgi:hypothetical protein